MTNFEKAYKLVLVNQLRAYHPYDEQERKAVEETLNFLNRNDYFLGKYNIKAHVTGSSWVINQTKDKVLLTLHNKLKLWVQLGGHTEKYEKVEETSLRETYEETGLKAIKILNNNIFDIDVCYVPKWHTCQEHKHYDIRYLVEANENEMLKISSESEDLRWVHFEDVARLNSDPAFTRMISKIRMMQA